MVNVRKKCSRSQFSFSERYRVSDLNAYADIIPVKEVLKRHKEGALQYFLFQQNAFPIEDIIFFDTAEEYNVYRIKFMTREGIKTYEVDAHASVYIIEMKLWEW